MPNFLIGSVAVKDSSSRMAVAPSGSQPVVSAAPPANRWKILVPVGVLVAVLALATAFWLGRGGRGSAGTAAQPGTASIAVLPFVNMSSVELDPLSLAAQKALGFVAYRAGRLEEAAAAFKKALELNPERPGAHTLLGRVYLVQVHPQEALAEMEREPEPMWRLYGLALAYHALGRKKEADAALAEFVAKYNADGAYKIAEVYAFRGETDKAFEWLERAYAQRDPGLSEIKGDPLLKNLERDPRYAAFLKRMRLPA